MYEVTGGNWLRRGASLDLEVFAYNVSLACNHCEEPICVEICPARALAKRADGIVLIDADKCIGCKYCSWACPYGAPQYDAEAGRMTKCTFCVEDLDAGLPPSCVAACPLRALDFGDRAELEARYGSPDAVYPLPEPGLTEPALAITPHQDAAQAGHRLGPGWEQGRGERAMKELLAGSIHPPLTDGRGRVLGVGRAAAGHQAGRDRGGDADECALWWSAP